MIYVLSVVIIPGRWLTAKWIDVMTSKHSKLFVLIAVFIGMQIANRLTMIATDVLVCLFVSLSLTKAFKVKD